MGKNKAIHTIDLHGMTKEEAIQAVEQALNDCIMSEDVYKIEIIHGLGKGHLKQAVSKYLAKIKVIDSFQVDPKNPGVTWVKL